MTKLTKITEEEDSVKIKTDAKRITIHTRNGEINLFMGNNHKSITSFVEDVKIVTWYNFNPKKISRFKRASGQRMVVIGER